MLSYYAIYKKDASEPPPRGIFIQDARTGDALLWNHRSKAWLYDPDLVERFLDDFRNWDRVEQVDRATAERITVQITEHEGISEPLPDEDTIYWAFQWKGAPPQSED